MTWYEDPEAPLGPGLYDGEVWITDPDGRVLKLPQSGTFRVDVQPAIPAADAS
ncbi:MAG: hypothetical protein ABI640_12890 [Gammaproteobacteria bacterium]